MRFKEYLLKEQRLSNDEIMRILRSMDQEDKWITIRPDGKVDLDSNIHIFDDDLSNEGTLQVTFNKIVGSLVCTGSEGLKSLKNSPNTVLGEVKIRNCPNLKSLEGMPQVVHGNFQVFACHSVKSLDGVNIKEFFGDEITIDCGMTSFRGIEKHFDFQQHHNGIIFYFDYDAIKEGGLGLILIPGLKTLSPLNLMSEDGPWGIIKKYLDRPDDLFECQAELIDNGYEEYAQL